MVCTNTLQGFGGFVINYIRILLTLINMKKILFAIACCALLSSCSMTQPICATSNPVGNKRGESSYYKVLFIVPRNLDAGIDKAAKEAGITKISHVDQNIKNYLVWQKFTTRVYGE